MHVFMVSSLIFRNNRTGKCGSGVAIYLRNDILFKMLSSSPSLYSSSLEHLLIEIKVDGIKVALGVVYCPPSIYYFSSFGSLLSFISAEYTHQIITCDFNTDLLKYSSKIRPLKALIESVALTVFSP